MNNDLSIVTSKRIKELRTKHGYTMEDLAKKMDVSKSTIAKWENGYVDNMKTKNVSKLCDIFGVKPTYILGLEDLDKEEQFTLLYRQLPEDQKELIDNMLKTLTSKQ